ncbi:MAG TPA: endonuclease/exonuclease/phosphatase family protein [Kofleriaceae bacterium]
MRWLLPVLVACTNHGIPADLHVEAVFPDSGAALPHPMRVVEFNVEMKPGAEVLAALRSDPQLASADLVILEEVHRSHLGCSAACFVGKELGLYQIYAPGHANGDGDDGVAILSRAPITSSTVITLPGYNVHLNGGRRVTLEATIDRDGHPITVYAVHLENRITVAERRVQMLPVLERAAKQPNPVIVAGDLNTSPFTWLFHLVPIPTGTQDDRMEELARAYGFATPVAESGATSRYLAMKLDAIYTRGLRTEKFATADAAGLSDHLAMWAVMD